MGKRYSAKIHRALQIVEMHFSHLAAILNL